jgi:hypothetical protein
VFGTGLALVALFFSGRIGPEHALLSLKLLPVMLLGLSSARWTAPLLDRCWMRPAVLLLFAAVSGLAA